jgi:hypothetical protein
LPPGAGGVQRYGFTQVGYVGQGAPKMLVFLANPSAPALAAPANPQAPSRFPDPHLPRLLGGQGQPPQPGGAAQNAQAGPPQQAQPDQMPAVPSQPLNVPPGIPLNNPGAVAPVSLPSLRLPGSDAADRVAIDSRQLQVRRDGGDWKLAMGNHVIASFGPGEGDARIAAAALRYYRCTEQVFVGSPRPVFSYFLSNGQAPHGSMAGLDATAFRPESLAVRQMGKSYVLYDGNQVVLSFGDRASDAQQALQAIRQHKFDHLTMVGRGDQSMMLLYRAN